MKNPLHPKSCLASFDVNHHSIDTLIMKFCVNHSPHRHGAFTGIFNQAMDHVERMLRDPAACDRVFRKTIEQFGRPGYPVLITPTAMVEAFAERSVVNVQCSTALTGAQAVQVIWIDDTPTLIMAARYTICMVPEHTPRCLTFLVVKLLHAICMVFTSAFYALNGIQIPEGCIAGAPVHFGSVIVTTPNGRRVVKGHAGMGFEEALLNGRLTCESGPCPYATQLILYNKDKSMRRCPDLLLDSVFAVPVAPHHYQGDNSINGQQQASTQHHRSSVLAAFPDFTPPSAFPLTHLDNIPRCPVVAPISLTAVQAYATKTMTNTLSSAAPPAPPVAVSSLLKASTPLRGSTAVSASKPKATPLRFAAVPLNISARATAASSGSEPSTTTGQSASSLLSLQSASSPADMGCNNEQGERIEDTESDDEVIIITQKYSLSDEQRKRYCVEEAASEEQPRKVPKKMEEEEELYWTEEAASPAAKKTRSSASFDRAPKPFNNDSVDARCWKESATEVIHLLRKHPSLMRTRNIDPVVEVWLKGLIELEAGLKSKHVQDAVAFLNSLTNLFTVPDQSNGQSKQWAIVVKFVKALCLEVLPIVGYEAQENGRLPVRYQAVRNKSRQDRENSLAATDISVFPRAFLRKKCEALFRGIEKCSNDDELWLIEFFQALEMPTDYATHVRKPVDLVTIKHSLLGTKPDDSAGLLFTRKYSRFSEFFADLRLVFANAIAYNSIHKDDDVSGCSQMLYDAAMGLACRTEVHLERFTLDMRDHLDRAAMESKAQDAPKKLPHGAMANVREYVLDLDSDDEES